MSDILNDGSVVADSRQITIGGVTYDCTNWKWSEKDIEVVRKGIYGQVTGRKYSDSKDQTATAVAQLPSTTSPLPPMGRNGQFTTPDINGVVSTCYICERGRDETSGGETTVPITVKKAIGAIVTS